MLRMEDVVNYCGDDNSRSFVEGNEILKNRLLIECTTERKRDNFIEIFAKCLKNSDRNSRLHEISYEISIRLKKKTSETEETLDKSYKIEKAECTCKTDNEKCQHILAVLIKLERTEENEQKDFYSHVLLQPWGGLSQPLHSERVKNLLNNPVPVKELTCILNEESPQSPNARMENSGVVGRSSNELRELSPNAVRKAILLLNIRSELFA